MPGPAGFWRCCSATFASPSHGGDSMRVFLWGVLAALMPLTASALDLVGGGLKVASVEHVDDSKAVIKLDNGDGGIDSIWVDCIGSQWGYEGSEAGASVKADQKSQAIAYRACRDLPYKASLTQSPGSWKAAVQLSEPAPRVYTVPPSPPAASSTALPTIKRPASIEECRKTIQNTIVELGVSPVDVIPIVNTRIMTVTRICTADGSLLITCSGPDEQMLITKSPHGDDVGCR